eukprot:Tbor_TRINITY_DN5465_c7_g5::TRINITY_DN5465_c7_g5_i1::g.24553::m.24553
MVISHNQIWGNIQLSGSPDRMIWDLNDTRSWSPLINNEGISSSLLQYSHSIQRNHLTFPEIKPNQAEELEIHIKKIVKNALKTWRNNKQPNYHQRIGIILREVLIQLEKERREHANFHQNFIKERHISAISEFSSEFEAIGIPVNVCYFDENCFELLYNIYHTCISEIGTDSVVYALSVYIMPYSGNVISIWVYLVGLVSRDPRKR